MTNLLTHSSLLLPLFQFSIHSDISRHPAEIQFFIRYSFEIQSDCGNKHISHTFPVVDWPQVHPAKDSIGKPVQIWCHKLYENAINNCYIPVENIVSRVICAIDTFEEERVLFVVSVID